MIPPQQQASNNNNTSFKNVLQVIVMMLSVGICCTSRFAAGFPTRLLQRSSSAAAARKIGKFQMIVTDPTMSTSLPATDGSTVSEPSHGGVVVVCGPSGVGKGTVIEGLMKRFRTNQIGFSVSHTTRNPRPGEVDGIHYHFTTIDQIQQDIANGKFIEYAQVHGNYYGTSIAAVESVQAAGKICILDIDVQGVQKVKQSALSPRYLFIAPPSLEELEKRLRGRGTETEEAMTRRLGNAAKEVEYGQTPGNFDRIFVNADLDATVENMVNTFKEWYSHLEEIVPEDAKSEL